MKVGTEAVLAMLLGILASGIVEELPVSAQSSTPAAYSRVYLALVQTARSRWHVVDVAVINVPTVRPVNCYVPVTRCAAGDSSTVGSVDR